MRIAGVVTLYNPDYKVINNINTYIDQLDILYIIDNGNSSEIISELDLRIKIKIIYSDNNIGIAKAMNMAANKAYKNNYRWLLTMDQDSSFDVGEVDKYFNEFKKNIDNNVAIFSPNHSKKNNDDNNLSTPKIVMSSGNLINLDIYNKVGGFEDKLFIDEVDHDYCLKVKSFGYNIIKFNHIILNHELGDINKGLFEYNFHSSLRTYYITRNNLYIWKKYFKSFPKFIIKRIIDYIIFIIKIILLEQNKKDKFINIYYGVKDFIYGNYGVKSKK